jgi:hypothetical protein
MFGVLSRIRELNGTLSRLERKLDDFTLDFEETVNRVNKSLRRIASERARIEAQDHPEPEGADPASPPVDGSGPHGNLSERQRQIQQQILRRRAGMQ